MYVPPVFKEDNITEIESFVRTYSFASLVSRKDGDRLVATHLPLMIERNTHQDWVLLGHLSRANPQWKSFNDGQEVLAIFHGPHAYISSSWYGHENVSTWNYQAVHVYGFIRLIEEERLETYLSNLQEKYEMMQDNPFLMKHMSADFVRRELRGVIGFEIHVTSVEAAYKLSQNRSPVDVKNIINHLENQHDSNAIAIAHVMKSKHKL